MSKVLEELVVIGKEITIHDSGFELANSAQQASYEAASKVIDELYEVAPLLYHYCELAERTRVEFKAGMGDLSLSRSEEWRTVIGFCNEFVPGYKKPQTVIFDVKQNASDMYGEPDMIHTGELIRTEFCIRPITDNNYSITVDAWWRSRQIGETWGQLYRLMKRHLRGVEALWIPQKVGAAYHSRAANLKDTKDQDLTKKSDYLCAIPELLGAIPQLALDAVKMMMHNIAYRTSNLGDEIKRLENKSTPGISEVRKLLKT